MISLDVIKEDILDTLTSNVLREMVINTRQYAWRYADAYLEGLSVEREGDAIVVRVKGDIPNFIEHGLGPGGLGTEGPFDMRQNVLKGRERRAIPIAPGVIRMMSANGAPWIHPGFKRHALLPMLIENMDSVLEQSAKMGRWWRYTDGTWRKDWM